MRKMEEFMDDAIMNRAMSHHMISRTQDELEIAEIALSQAHTFLGSIEYKNKKLLNTSLKVWEKISDLEDKVCECVLVLGKMRQTAYSDLQKLSYVAGRSQPVPKKESPSKNKKVSGGSNDSRK